MHLCQFLSDTQFTTFLELLQARPNGILLKNNPKSIFIAIFNRDRPCVIEVSIREQDDTIAQDGTTSTTARCAAGSHEETIICVARCRSLRHAFRATEARCPRDCIVVRGVVVVVGIVVVIVGIVVVASADIGVIVVVVVVPPWEIGNVAIGVIIYD
jgi:hypothetical protein